MEEEINFGTCCACGREDKTVRNLIMLEKRAPVSGTGWGCMQCRMPMDGAIAVICDECLNKDKPVVWVIYGMVANGERVLLSTCTEPFRHNMKYHPEVAGTSFMGAN